jgi:hypothetical protein
MHLSFQEWGIDRIPRLHRSPLSKSIGLVLSLASHQCHSSQARVGCPSRTVQQGPPYSLHYALLSPCHGKANGGVWANDRLIRSPRANLFPIVACSHLSRGPA